MFPEKRGTGRLTSGVSVAVVAVLWAGLAASALAGGKGGGKKADTTPPGAVDDLTVLAWSHNSISIGWTATGDDGRSSGTASSYDIRYAIQPITEENFADPMVTTQVGCPPTPRPPRELESVTVGGLLTDETYYVALKVCDEAANCSDLSNLVWQTTDLTDSTPASGLWQVQTVDATDESHFSYASLHFDPVSGNPGIAYWQSHFFDGLKFAEWNDADSCWKIEDVLEGYPNGLDFAYDPTGVPTITYLDDNVYFAEKVGSSWSFVNLGGQRYGEEPSLAYDPYGNPAISYTAVSGRGRNKQNELHFVRWEGLSWTREEERTVAATDGSSSDLAFDPSDGHPAIAYSAADALKLARYNGTAWDIEVVDTGPGYGTRVALAFDPMTGSPAMLHVGDLDTVRFVLWDGSQWQKTDLDPTALMVLDCALWLDWDGTAWAAWGADDGLQWELKVRRRDPATGLWAAPEVVEDSPGLITHISLKRSPASGTLCISYSYGTGAHVHGSVEELRYATRGTP